MRLARSVALLALVAASARASEPDRFGFGTRGPAMGATGAATADDYEATYANPAGLAFAPARRLTVGAVFGRYGVSLDGQSHPVGDTSGLLIGADLPLPLGGALERRLALGLGFYLPFGVINRADAPFPDVPALPLLDNPTQTVSVMVAGSVRLLDRLSIGGGVLALAALTGAIHLATDAGGHIISRAEEQLVTDYAPIVGVRWQGARVRGGVVLRGRSQSRYDITIDNKLTGVVPFDLPTFAISGVSQYDPLQAGAEVSFAATPSWLLVAQLTWKHWSPFPLPSQNATAGAPPQPPPGFPDTAVPRVGAEWTRDLGPLALALRGGYFFEPTPAPDAAPTRTLLDASRHVITAGGELRLRNRYAPLHLELFFQWHALQPTERVHGGFGAGGVSLGAEL